MQSSTCMTQIFNPRSIMNTSWFIRFCCPRGGGKHDDWGPFIYYIYIFIYLFDPPWRLKVSVGAGDLSSMCNNTHCAVTERRLRFETTLSTLIKPLNGWWLCFDIKPPNSVKVKRTNHPDDGTSHLACWCFFFLYLLQFPIRISHSNESIYVR